MKILLLVLALPLFAGINSYPEVTGTAATVQASSNPLDLCAFVQIIAPSGNSAVVRVGDSSTTSARGLPLAPGSGQLLPPIPGHSYVLTGLYFYVALGDKVDFACGT